MKFSGFAATTLFLTVPTLATVAAEVRFNRDIRPIMSDTCFLCHGPDKNARKAKMRLDIREEALKPAKSGALPIVPGKPEESEVVKRLFTKDEDDRMPPGPPKFHKTLTPEQRELFKRWVAEGAVYEPHWAYTKLTRPEAPKIRNSKLEIRNPIDNFILHALETKNITPSREADKRTLLRRLSLDLIGLPPTPAKVNAFLADKSPRAYERQVERLLASPHYGERMAVPWLDAVRFSDTVGYHGDQIQRIFPYRDYVIDAFNKNKPFDQFTIEQLAGDLLPNATAEQRVATGFNRLNMMTREGGAQPKEYLAKYAGDRVRTVAGAWLGSTMGCCECHDHKFDPFTSKDFYSLEAFFADVKQWGYYADAAYARNPELKGFSNDHPWPPEMEVESNYLKQRQARLQRQISEMTFAASAKLDTDAQAKAAFVKWREQATAFLKTSPTGWATPTPAVNSSPASPPVTKKEKKAAKAAAPAAPKKSEPAKPAVESAKTNAPGFAVEADGRITFAAKFADNTRIALPLSAGWLATIRIELLPHEKNGGSIVRGSATNSTTVKLTAVLRKKDAKNDTVLAIRDADADRKEPRYFNGIEIPGVKEMWKTSEKDWNKPHTAFWLLDQPVAVADGDVLTVTLAGDTAGCVRVSVSPFAPQNPLAAVWAASLRKALKNPRGAAAREAYLAGTGWDAAAFTKYKSLFAEVRECNDGRAMTMVTQRMEPLTIRVLPRGNWQDESGEVLQPAVPHFLPQPRTTSTNRLTRLDLARWLVSPENPLTSRTIMNRMWKQFFGWGISAQVDDLGAQGEWPVHPELLDWLAVEFRDSGWNVKHMVKFIVMSATYRQDSNLRPELRDLDPNNRLLASQNPRRLEAEFVRDNALFIAGLLNLDIGGPSAHPYQPAGYYANLQFPNRDYTADTDDRQYRRGVYTHWQRTFLQPMMANFDAPAREECTCTRTVANTPQQALTLLNDPTFIEAARVLAAQLLAAPTKNDDERIERVFQIVLARSPKPKEKVSLVEFLSEQRQGYTTNADDAKKLLHIGLAPAPPSNETELAAWTTVCRVVLNLHEAITRY